MQNIMKYLYCLLVCVLFTTALQAQGSEDKNSNLSVHIGPSWYLGHWMGITDRTDAYCDGLRKGMAWDVSYFQLLVGRRLKFGLGFLYQGSSYKNTHETGSDKIQMHYLAPQLVWAYVQKRYQIQFSDGLGYQFYHDKSTVYGKPRKVSMNKWAANLALSGEYYLTRHWGVSGRLNWLISGSERYSVDYHNEHWEVKHPNTGSGYFGQLSLTFGLNYHF